MKQTDFADRRGVSRATVSKWKTKGLLRFDDAGLIDVEATERVLDDRPAVYRGGVAHRPNPPAPGNNPAAGNTMGAEPGDEARTALVDAIDRSEAIVAYAVVAAGGTTEVAFCAASIARLEFMDAAAGHLVAISARWIEPDDTLGPVPVTPFPPNWPALATIAGERVAIERWRKAERRRPYWADPEPDEPPHPWLEKAS